MDSKKRELILRLADGNPLNLPILHQLDGFKHSSHIFRWLVDNKITGQKFYDVYFHDYKCSWLTMGKHIIMKIKKENEMKPIYAGKDYRSL